MKLFTVGRVGCFCEAVNLSTETRRGETVKIAIVSLRVDPFDHKLATAMGCDGVRAVLFKLSHPDPNPILGKHVDLAIGAPRQVLRVFEAPDVPHTAIAFDQARIYGVHALSRNDSSGFALRFKASFGPLGARELEYLNAWRLSQRFVTFDEAEPGMFDEETEDEDDEEQADDTPARPPLEFETTGEGAPLQASADDQEPARQMPRRHARKPH